ncbi:MAG: glycosyltransferase family 39 protein [Bacteroidota bacterium]
MPQRIFHLFVLSFLVFCIFAHLDDHQLEVWDEARRGVNAIEMASGDHHFLVTHYAGAPDHLGTKPPLLIWLQALFVHIFGIGELAVRLPAALATVGLLSLLCWWSRRLRGDITLGVLAAGIIFCYRDYTFIHGFRSGDFDALLILFLTAQLAFFHQWITQEKRKYLILAGLAVFLAGMTKGIAGGFFLPGVGLWILLDNKRRQRLLQPGIYLSVGSAILLVAAYYFFREQVDPGYLEAVMGNELSGRYLETNENHAHPFHYYLFRLWETPTFGVLFALTPFAVFLLYSDQKSRSWSSLLSITLIVFLVVISISATKLYWYASPALPIIGLLVAGLLLNIGDGLARQVHQYLRPLVVPFLAASLFLHPFLALGERVLHPGRHYVSAADYLVYRNPLKDFDHFTNFTLLARNYNPNVRFYVGQANQKGKGIDLRHLTDEPIPSSAARFQLPKLTKEDLVMVCHMDTWRYVIDHYWTEDEAASGPCKMIKIKAPKT